MNRRYILWGWTSRWNVKPSPIPIMIGNLRECRSRQRQFQEDYPDALTGIYVKGDNPKGLSIQVAERVEQ